MTEKSSISISVQCEQIQDTFAEEDEMVLLYETSSGEQVFRQNTSIIVRLPEGRSVLTSSWLNGGYRCVLPSLL